MGSRTRSSTGATWRTETGAMCKQQALEPYMEPDQSQSGSAEDQRFSLDDDTAARVFTITITDLRAEDGGTYWCGVKRPKPLPDLYTEILLLVEQGDPPAVSPSTYSPPSVQTQSTPLSSFPTTVVQELQIREMDRVVPVVHVKDEPHGTALMEIGILRVLLCCLGATVKLLKVVQDFANHGFCKSERKLGYLTFS
ncbi:hypothetical protein SRHO_G00179200 [Serrasalmus rhombeus]